MRCGVIPIDKPQGFTSFDVIAKCRGILKERRLGHSGTLDPLATGVLPVFIGRATRAVDILPDGLKSYRAGFALGYSTDTQDITGTVVRSGGVRVTRRDIEQSLPQFYGKISQVPPMYSAVKVDGKRLYDLARRGVTVERKPREIEVFGLRLTGFDEQTQSGTLEVDCSKGTYIRTLINDIGEALGAFGTMTELRRTYSQGFCEESCVTLEQLEYAARSGCVNELIIPVDSCFREYPAVRLSEKQEKMYKNGVALDPERVAGAAENGIYRVYGGGFLGIAMVDGKLRPYKNFWGDE